MELPNPNLHRSELSHINALDYQILHPFSLSMPSEPPEITNWFPSYQYESPVIETSDILGDFKAEEHGIGKEKLFCNDSESAKDESLPGLGESAKIEKVDQKSLIDNIDIPCLPTLDSEPIHVRNWFSSYEYESPALDTSDGLRDSAYKDSEHDIEARNTGKDEFNVDFPSIRKRNDDESTGLVDYEISCGDNKQETQSLNQADSRSGKRSEILSDKSNTCLESVIKRCSKYALLQNQEIISTSGDFSGPNLDLEDSQCTLNFSEKSRYKTETEKDYNSVTIDEGLTFRSLQRSDTKENDGFVTTRKGRFSKAREEVHLEKRKGYEKGTERKVLGERTNSQLPCVSGITGKWKCPQKRKPDLGPPLKQLRLERWIHRL